MDNGRVSVREAGSFSLRGFVEGPLERARLDLELELRRPLAFDYPTEEKRILRELALDTLAPGSWPVGTHSPGSKSDSHCSVTSKNRPLDTGSVPSSLLGSDSSSLVSLE